MVENNLLSLIIFAPLAGAVINWLIGGRLKNETVQRARRVRDDRCFDDRRVL